MYCWNIMAMHWVSTISCEIPSVTEMPTSNLKLRDALALVNDEKEDWLHLGTWRAGPGSGCQESFCSRSWLIRKFVKPMNIDFAVEALRKLAFFRYAGFEDETVGSKWLYGTDKEEEECKKPRKQAPTRHQPFKNWHVGISKSSTHSALLLKKYFCGLLSRMTLADINKIEASECLLSRTTLADVNKTEASECHSVPVL